MRWKSFFRLIPFIVTPAILWAITVWVVSYLYVDQAVLNLGRISNWASFMIRNDDTFKKSQSAADLALIPLSTRKAFNSYVIKFPISFYGFVDTERFLRVRSPLSEMRTLPDSLNFSRMVEVDGDTIYSVKTKTPEGSTLIVVKSVMRKADRSSTYLLTAQELVEYDAFFNSFAIFSFVFYLVIAFIIWYSFRVTAGQLIKQIESLNRAVHTLGSGGEKYLEALKSSRFTAIGELAKEIANYVEIQRLWAQAIEDISKNLSSDSTNLTMVTEHQRQAFGDLNASIVDVSASSTQISRSSESITSLAGLIHNQASSNKKQIQKANKSIEAIAEQMDEIETMSEQFRQLLEKNIREIENINRIAEVVNRINEELKLISFNAQLESVGNSKQVQRFQVVANEVRELARETEKTLVQIRRQLIEIIDHTRESGSMFSHVKEAVSNGTRQLHDLEKVFKNLAEQHEQTVGSVQMITRAANEQLDALGQIAGSMNGMRLEAEQLTAQLTKLTEQAADLSQNGKRLEFIIQSAK